jgi:membrane protease YdiL (CAAX protease family)
VFPAIPSRRDLWRLVAGFYGIVTVFALGYALFSGNLGTVLGERAPSAGGVLGALGIAAGLVVLARVGVHLWPPVARTADAIQGTLGPLTWKEAALLALVSGVAEELLFRGALWPHLGLWGSALLFGLVHVFPRRPVWVYPLFAAIGGLFLGILRKADGNVLPPIVAHVLVNALNLGWLGARARKGTSAP